MARSVVRRRQAAGVEYLRRSPRAAVSKLQARASTTRRARLSRSFARSRRRSRSCRPPRSSGSRRRSRGQRTLHRVRTCPRPRRRRARLRRRSLESALQEQNLERARLADGTACARAGAEVGARSPTTRRGGPSARVELAAPQRPAAAPQPPAGGPSARATRAACAFRPSRACTSGDAPLGRIERIERSAASGSYPSASGQREVAIPRAPAAPGAAAPPEEMPLGYVVASGFFLAIAVVGFGLWLAFEVISL